MKANLYLNLYETVCYDYFHLKTPLKLLVKPFLHTFFSLITWITKLYIKQPVERPQQILANYGHIS